jgi:hypothetical protein
MYLSPKLIGLIREALRCGNKTHGAENILPYSTTNLMSQRKPLCLRRAAFSGSRHSLSAVTVNEGPAMRDFAIIVAHLDFG